MHCTYPLAPNKYVWLKPISNTETEINGLVNSLPRLLSVKGHSTLCCGGGIIGICLFFEDNTVLFFKKFIQ